MESIKEIFRIGYGPSSSHTMGPGRAAKHYLNKHPEFSNFRVYLYGSLALTGKGHLTDFAIIEAMKPANVEIIWQAEKSLPKHPNAMTFCCLGENTELFPENIYSVGGGKIIFEEEETDSSKSGVYPHTSMTEILKWHKETGKTFWEFVYDFDSPEIAEHLKEVWDVMKKAIERGINSEGLIPGGLRLQRKSGSYFMRSKGLAKEGNHSSLLFAYALAVSEENACGGKIVTAPTCGSCGVLPAVLYSMQHQYQLTDEKIIRALATAGLIGNLVKTNASISGAEVGCQGEIGTACAMAAAAATQILGGTPFQIEYAAEMGLEHHLGLTCDPLAGLVQVPCIERNVHAAARAYNSALFAMLSDGNHLISFDNVTKVLKQTGKDLPALYRETALGGLAIIENL